MLGRLLRAARIESAILTEAHTAVQRCCHLLVLSESFVTIDQIGFRVSFFIYVRIFMSLIWKLYFSAFFFCTLGRCDFIFAISTFLFLSLDCRCISPLNVVGSPYRLLIINSIERSVFFGGEGVNAACLVVCEYFITLLFLVFHFP